MTQTLLKTQRTEALELAERVTIASVLTWDAVGKTFSPDDIEAICLDGDMVWVKLSQGSYPISRYMFRSILEAQRAAINKQIEQIIDLEAQEVAEPEETAETIQSGWHPFFIPCGEHRGWRMELMHKQDGRYLAQVTKNGTFETVCSDKLYTVEQKSDAIAYMKGLIDWDEDFNVIGQ